MMKLFLNTRMRLMGWASFSAAVLLFSATGCRHVERQAPLEKHAYAELHMATIFRMVMYTPNQQTADRAAEAAFRRIIDLETMMTDYNTNSELMQICQKPAGQAVKVSPDLFSILQRSQEVARKSKGAFDITVGPFVALWRKARKTHVLPAVEEIAAAAKSVGYAKLELDARRQTARLNAPNMKLDLGGIAKGLAADQALSVLRKMGIHRAMVAASGDIALGDPPPGKSGWDIGIASIDHPMQGLTGEVILRNVGISTSGDTEQFVEVGGRRYSHIVDPKTGVGLTERIGVTIIARTATESDSLATAACVLGAKRGLDFVEKWPGAAALVVQLTTDGTTVTPSRRFQQYTGKTNR